MFNMNGHIDFNFSTFQIALIQYENIYRDGIYSSNYDLNYFGSHEFGSVMFSAAPNIQPPDGLVGITRTCDANVQPLNPREREALEQGGQRLVDARKIYLNSGDIVREFAPNKVVIDGLDGVYDIVSTDIRPAREYYKMVVARMDT